MRDTDTAQGASRHDDRSELVNFGNQVRRILCWQSLNFSALDLAYGSEQVGVSSGGVRFLVLVPGVGGLPEGLF